MIDAQLPPAIGAETDTDGTLGRDGQWIANRQCPLCGGKGRRLGPLLLQHFFFGAVPVPDAPGTVELHRCIDCTLVYKNWVPSPALLLSLTAATESELWTDSYDFADELRFIRAQPRARDGTLDLLDIGAAGGGLLNHAVYAGRRSAMDIVPFSRLSHRGEYIQGFLEGAALRWSGNPYDVVTVFDVLEHLYEPTKAVLNLQALTKSDGMVVIETGDADTIDNAALPAWPYLNYVEHHMAWNRRSLEQFARFGGFEVAVYENKQHKLAPLSVDTATLKMRRWALGSLPRLTKALYRLLGKRVPLVADPQRIDHLRAVLTTANATTEWMA